MQSYDFIILGGGSAGCVLANKLSENGKYTVCLLEAGPKNRHWSIKIPLGIVDLMKNKILNWRYYSTKEPHLNNRRILNPRGRTLGGSSSINAMLYVRGQKEDYDHWEQLGNKGWSYKDVLPYFKQTQHQERGSSAFHGTKGPLNVADSRSKQSIHTTFLNALKTLGYKANNDFNGEVQEGVGFYQVTQKNGFRCSAADAFLTPIITRKNLTVITDAKVHRILFNNKKATGIEYSQNNQTKQLTANKEVLLSAGAFNSPQLLLLSGIGSKAELAQHNIPLIHELKGVGENLQEHVDVITSVEYNHKNLIAYRPKAIWWLLKESVKFLKNKTGILTSPVAESGGFIKSSLEQETPDLQLHFIPAAMDNHGLNWKMLLKYGIALHACVLRPQSRGKVTLVDNNINTPPRIHLNLLSHADDAKKLIEAIKISRNILYASPLNANPNLEIFPGKNCQSDDQLLTFIKNKANTIYHPVGTCKMGNDDMAVVNHELKVHGIENLRVIDCSIMPTLISGNTNAPAIMIADKISDAILKEYEG